MPISIRLFQQVIQNISFIIFYGKGYIRYHNPISKPMKTAILRILVILIFIIVLPLAIAITVTDLLYLDLSWMVMIWMTTLILSIIALKHIDDRIKEK